jgi:CBS domain containing-hemolysin-like protein
LAPLVFTIARLSDTILRIAGVKEEDRRFFLTREELQGLVEESRQVGEMDSERERMIGEILDLRHTIVRDIMIPLSKIPRVDRGTTVREALPLMAETESPGVLAFDDSPDYIVGILFPAQLLNVGDATRVGDLMEPLPRVRDMDRVDQVLERLQQSWYHLALVIDREGNAGGLVTLEDAVAEIVGEIEEDVGRLDR